MQPRSKSVNQRSTRIRGRLDAANLPQYAGIPVLSAASPFKGGFGGAQRLHRRRRRHRSRSTTRPTCIFIRTRSTAVKIDRCDAEGWLETAAERFNRIDPAKTEPQELIKRTFPSYNFDMIQGGLTYAIDVTQRRAGNRIRDLCYRGRRRLRAGTGIHRRHEQLSRERRRTFPGPRRQEHRHFVGRCKPRRPDRVDTRA